MDFEAQVREFAAAFPTPKVRLMVQMCEDGTITWQQAYGIAAKAIREATI